MAFYQKETARGVRHATMLEVNEFLVLDYVRGHDPTTRTDIGRALDLSAASVSRIIGRLRADGLVTEEGTRRSEGGRPRGIVAFRRDAGSVIAVDLGGTRCQAVLADLAGTVLARDTRPTHAAGDAFSTLVAAIEAMEREAERRALPVESLAVGVPGILDPETGEAVGAPYVGWDGFPVLARLAAAVELPFVIDNDVNLAALAHAWRGDARGVSDFVTFSIGTGTGAAIVSDGRLLTGRHNAAGEVGHLILERANIGRPTTHSLGAYEAIASGPGIARRARELRETSGALLQTSPRDPGPAEVLDAAAAGDPLAGQVVGELLDQLAMAIITFTCTVDPDLVILEGGVGRALGRWLSELDDRIAPSVPFRPRLVTSTLGTDATVIGAVAAARDLARRRSAPAAVAGTFDISGVGRQAAVQPDARAGLSAQ